MNYKYRDVIKKLFDQIPVMTYQQLYQFLVIYYKKDAQNRNFAVNLISKLLEEVLLFKSDNNYMIALNAVDLVCVEKPKSVHMTNARIPAVTIKSTYIRAIKSFWAVLAKMAETYPSLSDEDYDVPDFELVRGIRTIVYIDHKNKKITEITTIDNGNEYMVSDYFKEYGYDISAAHSDTFERIAVVDNAKAVNIMPKLGFVKYYSVVPNKSGTENLILIKKYSIEERWADAKR